MVFHQGRPAQINKTLVKCWMILNITYYLKLDLQLSTFDGELQLSHSELLSYVCGGFIFSMFIPVWTIYFSIGLKPPPSYKHPLQVAKTMGFLVASQNLCWIFLSSSQVPFAKSCQIHGESGREGGRIARPGGGLMVEIDGYSIQKLL